MGLLDRIGKILKSGGTVSTTDSEPAKPASTSAPAQPSAQTSSSSDAPSTKGLFGGESDAKTEATAAKPAADARSTKGLFGGEADAAAIAAEAKLAEQPADTKGLFGAADVAATETKAEADNKGLFGAADVAATETKAEADNKGLFGAADVAATEIKAEADTPSGTEASAEAQERGIMPVHPKVLMIVHNPPVSSEGGKRLTEVFKWHDPDKLAKGYIEDLKTVSNGYLNYEIIERIDSDIFPPKTDGFAYTADQYVKVMRGEEKAHDPDWLDYQKRIETFDLQNRFLNGDYDEVWFFSFPYAGEYESIMGGPGGFWCNAPAIKNTDRFKRRFVMMGFNMERGVDCMLENFGHRSESIMTELYKRRGKKQDMWKLFTQYEKQNPGDAQCGWMHYAPNSVKDYDWGNTTKVTSYCDDWLSYPTLPHEGKTMDNKTWGGGDMRAHHMWWFEHIPKTTGENDGISNNWWEYMVDPNKV